MKRDSILLYFEPPLEKFEEIVSVPQTLKTGYIYSNFHPITIGKTEINKKLL